MGAPQEVFKDNQAPECKAENLNAFTQEINNVIGLAGLDVDPANFSQLGLAINLLIEASGALAPPGVPMPWPGETAPPGWAIVNEGLTFDVEQYPRLALAWPNGVIPPHKGLVIECAESAEKLRQTEQGEVKYHGHNAKLDNFTLSKTFTSSSAGSHYHRSGVGVYPYSSSQFDFPYGYDTISQKSGGWGNIYSNNPKMPRTDSKGAHTHTTAVSFAIDNKNVTVEETGETRNTVDRISYNMIVRLA